MKLISLTLSNFRQFTGEGNTIQFSKRKDKNVTVIFGANGAGKSTILNAFTWGLFGQTTPSFEHPEKILNDSAIVKARPGDVITAQVIIEFEHENRRYVARRTRTEKKIGQPNQTEVVREKDLEVQFIGEDGRTKFPKNPQDTIEQVLPDRLHSFFFFDGERIERLTKLNGGAEVGKAIKDLLGLELVERSMKHLNGEVKKKLDQELSKVATGDLQAKIDRISSLGEARDAELAALENHKKNLAALSSNLDDVKGRLRELQETFDLQRTLDGLEEREKERRAAIGDTDAKIKALLSRRAYLAFVDPLIERCHTILESSRQKGEIPSPIKKQFVADLLDKGKCICGSPLEKGTPHFDSVTSWLDRAGLADVEEAATRTMAQLKDYADGKASLFTDLRSLQELRERHSRELREITEQLSEVEGKLGDRGRKSEEAKELVERREALSRKINDAHREIGGCEGQIRNHKEQLHTLEKEKEKAEQVNVQAQLIQRRLKVTREAAEFFEKLYEASSDEVRSELDRRVKAIYQKISYTGNWPELTADYRLLLKKGVTSGDDVVTMGVSKSTGENQLLSLAFIGSIADYARERYDKYQKNPEAAGLGFTGGIYPMVMDSPFGSLDENYQGPLAQGIPRLADQVVVIASRKQALGTVYENLEGRVDKVYVLSRHTPKEEAGEMISIGGKPVAYLTPSKEERVDILEVS